MVGKQIVYNEEAWKKLDIGAKAVYEAVKVTLGPRGNNVVIANPWGSPTITKDGVTVAREIELKDPFENMGAQLIKEVASKTNDIAGDGTTTSTILGYEIFKEGLKSVKRGMNPTAVKRGIDKAIEMAIRDITSRSKSIDTKTAIAQVASISANNDKVIGDLIAEAMDKVGKDGIITIEESKGFETLLEVVEGMDYDKGYVSPYMINNQEKMEAVLENPFILITDKKISATTDIVPILEATMNMNRPLMIIAEDFDGEALQTIVLNILRGALKVVVTKSPGFGDRRKALLQDLAAVVGGTVISEETGLKLNETTVDMLGTASKVRVTKEHTTIIEGAGTADAIQARATAIRTQLEQTEAPHDRERLQERLAKLVGGVAVIKAGATTETELKEKKHRIEDALSATRAAVEEGIVAGGGTTLIRAITVVAELELHTTNEDERTGIAIVRKALESPLKTIALNAGLSGEVVVEKVKELKGNFGFNALTQVYEDLFKVGVVDPVKVTRCSLQHAASIASMLLTTSVLIAPIEEEKPQGQGMPDMSGMM